MKKSNYILCFIAVFAMFFTSCSKDDVTPPVDDLSSESAVLTFGAMLDNLANRAMSKQHFAQVPTCSDAEPAFAVIGLSVEGDEKPDVTVAILSDSNGYFTAYSLSLI